ncbi:esterase [Jiulongibacter sediminis]|jgi:enterochelin esterase family protein|uniref:esterase n=1 Tax=Jiulongibacter sediminis TaxID=1605367 RepID=UPI0026F19BA5|nr:esterase [Jiulongibacter sediminis]
MTRKLLTLVCLTLSLSQLALKAQEIPAEPESIISPNIHENHSVTFTFFAPQADTVKLISDLLPPEKIMTRFGIQDGPGSVLLHKDQNGLWTYTSDPLESELYSFWYLVDGIRVPDPNSPYVFRNGSTVTNVFTIGGGQADLYGDQDIAHGTVSRVWYDSPTVGIDRRLSVYLPAGYEESSEEYPVLYLLHGAGGDEESWLAHGRTAQIMDNLIASGKSKPMIVVMPNGNVSQDGGYGYGSYGFQKPVFLPPHSMNGEFEASFIDIVNFVEDRFRIKSGKEYRAIAGLSMGGFHTMHISRYYPNTFDYVGLFSAAILPREDATGKVYSDIDKNLKVQKDNGLKLYWIGIGKTDFLYEANTAYRKKLDDLNFPYEYRESGEGHIWKNWRIYLSEFARKLF